MIYAGQRRGVLRSNPASKAIHHIARQVERAASRLRGKGYGSFSTDHEAMLAIRALGRLPALVIDGGGNVGDYTAAIRGRVPDAKIVIFEPAAINVARLTQRFGDDNKVQIEAFGLSDEIGSATLFADRDGSGAASLSHRRLDHFGVTFENRENVQLTSLDDYWGKALDRRPIDILKLDIEGHEIRALRGGGEALRSISVVQFEFGGCNIDSRTYFQDLFYLFRENDFDLYRMTPIGLESIPHYTEDAEAFVTTNYLAVRRENASSPPH